MPRARCCPQKAGVSPSWVEACPRLGVPCTLVFQLGRTWDSKEGWPVTRGPQGSRDGPTWRGYDGGRTGSYLALGCVGHSPHRGDHGEGAGRLVGVLLPGDRVVGE